MAEVRIKRSRFDRKLDKIKELEESGALGKKNVNRSLRKLMNNKLAVIGIIIFSIILLKFIQNISTISIRKVGEL